MTREQFLSELKNELAPLSADERDEILRDQDEYIRDAVASGRSEEQVIAGLGSPKAFAASIAMESKIQRVENSPKLQQQVGSTFGAVFALLALAPLNFIFVLGPFLTLVGVNIAGWAAAVAILLGSMTGVGVWAFKLLFVSVGALAHLSSLFFILGCVGIGLLAFWAMLEITRLFVRATISYLKWNLSFIQTRK